MKHLVEEQKRLHSLLRAAETPVSTEVELKMLRYLEEIIRANEVVNLTRIDSMDSGIRLHLVDSILCLREVEACPRGKLVDIGTGGGFPGVPVCLASGRSGVLLDSAGKKARAVNKAIHLAELQADIVAVPQRSEGHALVAPAAYAVATARALAELPALVEIASPLLRLGGRLVALKGAPDELEIARADEAALMVGMRRISDRRLNLPDGGERRAVLVYERSGALRTGLPRRPGLAQKSPLA